MQEAAEARLGELLVVDSDGLQLVDNLVVARAKYSQGRLDTLGGRHGKQRLSHTSAESGEDCPRASELSVGIGQEALVLIERDEAYRQII